MSHQWLSETNRTGNGGCPQILVVDDDEAMLDACPQVLEREGFRVIAASNGADALDLMRHQRPDVIIVDLKMPGMSGEEFLREARQVDPEAVAVVITGYPSLSSAVEVMKAGAYDFLPKPFEAEELRIITKRAVEKRRLAQAVAAVEREKRRMHDNFVAMVTHQLKSPAACVKECLDAALRSFAPQMPEPCRQLVERAAVRSQLLLKLMDDWLTLARVESGAVRARAAPVEMCAVIQQAIAAAQEGPDHHQVAVQFEPQAPSAWVCGDEQTLRELFVNLIDNALRYTPDGGRALVRLSVERETVTVCVADTGPGIPPGEVELVFEPFFRGESARGTHGTGLGLAIVKEIAEAHGGRVLVQSEPGHGATFTVLLPAGEAQR